VNSYLKTSPEDEIFGNAHLIPSVWYTNTAVSKITLPTVISKILHVAVADPEISKGGAFKMGAHTPK
jgi:hypothetical protein